MARRAPGKVMTAPTRPQMMMMTSATRRRTCAWVVTRLARPGSPLACTPATMLDSRALARPTTTHERERMMPMRSACRAAWAQSGVATVATASSAPR